MNAIVSLLIMVLSILQLILFVRVVLTWFQNIYRSNPIVQFLYDFTEPILRPIRERLPQNSMGMDFSPMIVFIVIILLMRTLQAFSR
jgi:YggT family protein